MSEEPRYDGLDADQLRFLLRLRDRQSESSRRYWVRAAEEALAGDPRALRNRVEMAKLGPVEIVQSAATASPESAELGLKTNPKSPANPLNDLNISGPSSVQVDQQGDHEP